MQSACELLQAQANNSTLLTNRFLSHGQRSVKYVRNNGIHAKNAAKWLVHIHLECDNEPLVAGNSSKGVQGVGQVESGWTRKTSPCAHTNHTIGEIATVRRGGRSKLVST